MSTIPTPECDKALAVRPQTQAIGEFLEWLETAKGYRLAEGHEHSDKCNYGMIKYPICGFTSKQPVYAQYNVQELLAEFFNLDLKTMEAEKQALLDRFTQDLLT